MSGSNLAVLAHRNFSQFPKWPKSVKEDQAAIEQARRELGPDADAKQILARAQQITKRGQTKKQRQSARTASSADDRESSRSNLRQTCP